MLRSQTNSVTTLTLTCTSLQMLVHVRSTQTATNVMGLPDSVGLCVSNDCFFYHCFQVGQKDKSTVTKSVHLSTPTHIRYALFALLLCLSYIYEGNKMLQKINHTATQCSVVSLQSNPNVNRRASTPSMTFFLQHSFYKSHKSGLMGLQGEKNCFFNIRVY